MTDEEILALPVNPLNAVRKPMVRVTANDYAYNGWLVAVFRKKRSHTRAGRSTPTATMIGPVRKSRVIGAQARRRGVFRSAIDEQAPQVRSLYIHARRNQTVMPNAILGRKCRLARRW